MAAADTLALLDWKRRVFALYAAVRAMPPEAAWELWRDTREELLRRRLPLLPRCDERPRDLRRRTLPPRHGEGCGSRGRRREARARLQLRLQPVVFVRPRLGLSAGASGQPPPRRGRGGGAVRLVSELESLRNEISELDRRLLELLNRRLELVTAVRDYKDTAGERWIDSDREAELLEALVATNAGPL